MSKELKPIDSPRPAWDVLSPFEWEEFELNLIQIRRDLHAHPELSGVEYRTCDQIRKRLTQLGLVSHNRLCNTGVVVDIPIYNDHNNINTRSLSSSFSSIDHVVPPSPPPIVAVRADIDALPLQECTGLDYTSQNDGIMHACGHDCHTAILLGVAEILSRANPPPPSSHNPSILATIRLIFQPAEETMEGATAMIDAGVLRGVEWIGSLHVDATFPVGQVVIQEGCVNASVDNFTIVLKGHGGHGARPHQTSDGIVAACALVTSLQTIVARSVDPGKPCVLTVGEIYGGTAPNVIASCVTMRGTVRTHDDETREVAVEAIRRLAMSTGVMYGVEVIVDIASGPPALINSVEGTRIARCASKTVLGEGAAVQLKAANMGGEDFSFYLQKLPPGKGCYVRLGACLDSVPACHRVAHSDKFMVDERSIIIGVRLLLQMAYDAAIVVIKSKVSTASPT